MPFAEHAMIQGVTTAAQTATLPASININCGFLPSKVMITNKTQYGQTGTGNENIQQIFWDSTDASNTYNTFINAAGTAIIPGAITSNGISLYNGQNSVQLGATITGGALSKANPAQLTSTAHGLQTGDQIMITGPFTAATAMSQLGGIIFTVTVVNANAVTIPVNTNVANFTATTVTTWRKVKVGPLYYPQRATISNITSANPCVVTTTTNHGFTVGQQVRLRVPSALGMVEINNTQSVITAVTSTTFTLGNLDTSSGYTAWAWPASTSVPFTPAFAIPVGSGPSPVTFGNVTYNVDVLDDATLNQQFQGFTIGTGILVASGAGTVGVTASDVLTWTAWRADS